MQTLNTQYLNFLFSFLSNIENIVSYVKQPVTREQLYVSDSYEKIFQRKTETLYQNPRSFSEVLIPKEKELIIPAMVKRYETPGSQGLLYRIQRPDGHIRHIKDTAFTLIDSNNQPILTCGIAEALEPLQWHEHCEHGYLIEPNERLKQIFEIFQNESSSLSLMKPALQTSPQQNSGKKLCIYFSGEKILLSNRQTQCLEYLLQGYSTKEIAYKLQLSTRTVEEYLNYMKKKFNCRTIIAVISRIQREKGLIRYED